MSASIQYAAERIPDARFVEFPGHDHVPWADMDPLLDEVEEFLTGVRPAPRSDRVLKTVQRSADATRAS